MITNYLIAGGLALLLGVNLVASGMHPVAALGAALFIAGFVWHLFLE